MDDKLQDQLMQLELVKNHIREAFKILHEIARQDAKKTDIEDPEKFMELCNRSSLNTKVRDLLSAAQFLLKTEFVEMFWEIDARKS